MQTGYVILSGSVNRSSCEDDTFLNCGNFNLASFVVHKTFEEAIQVREQIIESDLEDFKSIWPEAEGFLFEVGTMGSYNRYIDVYSDGDVIKEVIHEAVYKIVEIDY